MPNQPAQDTITISFTMPRHLDEAVEARAKAEMTNKSDIIRRALKHWLGTEELRPGRPREIAKYPPIGKGGYEVNEVKTKAASLLSKAGAQLHKPK